MKKNSTGGGRHGAKGKGNKKQGRKRVVAAHFTNPPEDHSTPVPVAVVRPQTERREASSGESGLEAEVETSARAERQEGASGDISLELSLHASGSELEVQTEPGEDTGATCGEEDTPGPSEEGGTRHMRQVRREQRDRGAYSVIPSAGPSRKTAQGGEPHAERSGSAGGEGSRQSCEPGWRGRFGPGSERGRSGRRVSWSDGGEEDTDTQGAPHRCNKARLQGSGVSQTEEQRGWRTSPDGGGQGSTEWPCRGGQAAGATVQQPVGAELVGLRRGSGCAWIVGHSFIHRAQRRSIEAPVRGRSEMEQLGWRLAWFSHRGILWDDLLPFLQESIDMWGVPNILLVHLGGNDVGSVSCRTLLSNMKKRYCADNDSVAHYKDWMVGHYYPAVEPQGNNMIGGG
ncbi:uncharacterized protein LOC115086249 [Rhinatrema bivittatum]|uniref:uncharacterized protein LOC115086249 n=1 Tax=Rhinatrema bivittatum TaxID=194408 RepID=UPI00112B9081|nr:uncharacterized protein LOC115086249 [Rhinatrema bivittatum]